MSTRTTARTHSRTEDAARVARKLLGDLQSLNRYYGLHDDSYLRRLAHDVEVGLAHDCIGRVRVAFFEAGTERPMEVFDYLVADSGGLKTAPHSGRFRYNPALADCRMTMRITPNNQTAWEALKRGGHLKVKWTSASDLDLTGLSGSADGDYTSGELALRRTHYSRLAG